ncbi:neuron navigator 2 isoform X10 [Cricetulus griseus]|uniref:Neuron navigator 2 isoform X10 n=1 Tax=Cricetulus griseus TaxID=10029 RepID=A0A9J7JWK3_CRIGR|nr:neuron navigator 2 isoform X10 [Cricetulus griseus]XP_035311640.1 neuron navigator 2 isoform X10 [Cricetulus griseus]
MPAILVASKMKSGLPKPVHSAAPILHVPPARTGPQPCYLKLGSKVEVSKTAYTSQIPLKSQGLQEPTGEGLPLRKSSSLENGFDTQIYTDWANHYLAKSGHKRLIKDLQQDVTDGVLLAQIIQVVANDKIEDINGCPKNRSQMIENIDACLNFLAAKGINTQGLSAEEIRNGNLKAILGLFFSLSRYKQQQQQQPQKQHLSSSPLPPAGSQVAGAPSQCQAGIPQQQGLAAPQAPCQPLQPASHQQAKTQAEMQSRLPGPTARVAAAGSEAKTRAGSAAANNRRSQSFNNYDKSKPVTSPPPPLPPSNHEKEPLASSASSHPGMSENVSASLENSPAIPVNCSSAIPQPSMTSKPWRSKSLSVKHSATASMLSVKPTGPEVSRPTPEAMKPAPNNQKSMLEKLKLFNSKGGSKAGEGSTSRDTSCERLEILPSFEESEELEAASRALSTSSPASSSPKIALKGIAQRTFSRALTNKKSSPKGNEKEKEKQQREKEKEKEKGKDLTKRVSVTDRPDLKEDPKEELSGVSVTEMPKKSSKIASFIPKGGKLNSTKKEATAPSHSGIPKPGMKNMPGKSPSAATPPKEGERSRGKLSSGLPPQKPQLDSRHSSSSSSLASSEGKGPTGTTLNHSISSQTVSGSVGTTQTTGSNTVSVQLPQPQQQYNHPNTATVAPFLYRSQTDTEGNVTAESSSAGVSMEPSHYTKSGQPALEELTAEDPEARRLRTVKNIADLRQNLEETMSSLRGTQVTHSTLETTFDTNVTTEISGRSILSLTGRPTPLSWRLGQSSPRLQAGDAPSMGNGYPPRANASRFISAEAGRYVYSAPLRRQLASRGSSICHVDVSDKAGDDVDLEGISMDAPGYMSDGDVLSKNIRTDDITSGYMTDGGLGLYTRRLNRLPDGMAVVRETLQRNTSLGLGDADSWDDSSSVSSGISDTIDNLSTDDINTSSSISSYANTPASSRRNLDVQTDAEKHSQVERNSLWSGDDIKKSDGGSDSGVKMEPGSKWRRNPSDMSDESDKSVSGKKNPVISQTGSWRRGMTAEVGITMPRTKPSAPTGTLKTPGSGKTDDAKVSEKGRLSPKASQVKRSPSDAGRSSGDEAKKTLPSSSRMPTANSNSFGFKKQSGSAAGLAMITASGATITSRSATLGKIPKSSALVGRSTGRKTSMDGAPNQDDGYLSLSSRTNLQYRSLPRPSKSNSRNGAGNRCSTSSIDSNMSSKSAGLPVPKLREPSKTSLGSSLPGLVNQTDKEKGISSDNESVASCNSVKANPATQQVCGSAQATLQPGTKYSDVASPTLRRYTPTSQLRTQEDAKEWLRSHSAGGLQDTAANSPFSSGSSVTSPSGTRFNFSQLASPTTVTQMSLSNPTMLRTHSLSNADGQYDPYTDSRFRNSSMSLDEKSRTMSRSGSFRDGFEEVHGSSLSLVSSTSSIYSTPEEKCQSEIRKLRRELDASQEKVSALTTQLTANAHLVAAFEQSLGNMTIRLQSLTMTAEQKDSELNELRKTIELLKKQNAAAQAAINGVINTPELNCKGNGSSQTADLRIRRQHSSDSVSSINSATSHSSVGSNIESDSKKKKRKNWVNELRSSFKQAFGKKKSPKSASSHSDIEEMTDSSLPSSPKLPHNGSTGSTPLLRNAHSNSLISECMDSEAETVMQLRNELRDKEMKLTDIRLEALSSAHQLDQLREAMNRMQSEIEKLKAENDRLKSESQGSGCSRAPSQVSISASPRQSLGLSQHSLNLPESTSLDMLLDDTGECSARKEGGRHVKIVVSFQEAMKWKEDSRPHLFLIGCIGVSGKTKWDVLDGVVRRLFKEYIVHVDPVSQLGLNSDSVLGYSIGEIKRSNTSETPELLPCGYLVGENTTILVTVKGLTENSLDSLVFESLIPKPILQRYVSLLTEHRRIILSGPSGTGKTYLANRLSEYVVLREGRELTDGVIATFNVDHKSSKELRQYLSNLADQCNSENNAVDMPLVIILDNLHHVSSLGEIFNGLLNCKYHKCPYIIGTMNQATSSTPNLQLHHNFRWVLCANHTEPVKGFLGRFLRRKLMETEISGRVRNMELVKIINWIPKVWHHLNRFLEAHSSSDVTIGPRLFLSCPIDVDGSRVWFTDLWNYSIIPYLLEAVREGLQLYGRRAPWEDPAKWVMDTYPWAASPQQHEWPPLLQLRPEDVGFDGYSLPREGSTSKQVPPSDAEGDPLMNMLMRLQEAANYSSPQSYDSDSNSNSHHDDILDSSLESTL